MRADEQLLTEAAETFVPLLLERIENKEGGRDTVRMERSNEDSPIYIYRWSQRGTSTGPAVELRISVHCSDADADLDIAPASDAMRLSIQTYDGSTFLKNFQATFQLAPDDRERLVKWVKATLDAIVGSLPPPRE